MTAEILSLSDEDIVKRVQGGDTEAFGVLVERYEAKLLRYARKFLFGYHDAEDQVQIVFLKAFTNIRDFNTRRRFSPWLYRIAHNEFLNAIRKRGREPLPFFDPDTLFPHPVARERTDAVVLEQELKELLEQCLDKLDPKYREALVLYYFENMNYQEIAEVMQLPVSTVGVRLKRGKDMLRKFYTELHPQYDR